METILHATYRVLSFEIVAPHRLRLRFDDASEQTINFRRVLAGELYAPLNDLRLFNQVSIDTLVAGNLTTPTTQKNSKEDGISPAVPS